MNDQKPTKTENQLKEAVEYLVRISKDVSKPDAFTKLVEFLMKRGWSRSGARHRANLMLGGGTL